MTLLLILLLLVGFSIIGFVIKGVFLCVAAIRERASRASFSHSYEQMNRFFYVIWLGLCFTVVGGIVLLFLFEKEGFTATTYQYATGMPLPAGARLYPVKGIEGSADVEGIVIMSSKEKRKLYTKLLQDSSFQIILFKKEIDADTAFEDDSITITAASEEPPYQRPSDIEVDKAQCVSFQFHNGYEGKVIDFYRNSDTVRLQYFYGR